MALVEPKEAATSEPASDDMNTPPFTTFGLWQKRRIVFLAAFAGMFSPMSSFVFYPAITSIAEGLNTNVGMVNLAITTYMVVSGVTPAILGNAADKIGRRPIFILALAIYFVANVGLAVQNSFPALLVLRMLQSAGSSGTISLGYGVVSDVSTPAERGVYLGIMLLGPNVAPPLGPILGGVLSSNLGWKWIFWFLCIIGGLCLGLIFFTLPETCRLLVGNGSIPATGINRTPISCLRHRKRTLDEKMKRQKVSLPNPLACLMVLRVKDNAIVLSCNGIYYMLYCSVQASLSTLFIQTYGFQNLQASLVYIPFGVGCLTSSYVWGKVLNIDYARTRREHGLVVDKAREDKLDEFPLEEARLRSSFYLITATTVSTICFGWLVEEKVHVAAPLVFQTILGFSVTGLFVTLGTILTDLNSHRSATAAASANIVRCALAAAALAVLQLIIDGVGAGWCFTIFGGISTVCAPLLFYQMRNGHSWRRERAKKQLDCRSAVVETIQ